MIFLHGRTSETARPDLILKIGASEGHFNIRVDDRNNLPFWVELTVPLEDVRRLVAAETSGARYRVDPSSGQLDGDSYLMQTFAYETAHEIPNLGGERGTIRGTFSPDN